MEQLDDVYYVCGLKKCDICEDSGMKFCLGNKCKYCGDMYVVGNCLVNG